MPAAKSSRNTQRSRTPTSLSKKTAEGIALAAARLALVEYANSPERLDSMQATVAAATEQAIKRTLETLGIDTVHPEETRKDMVHLRTWRELIEFVRVQGWAAATRWVVIAVLGAMVVGTATMLNRG